MHRSPALRRFLVLTVLLGLMSGCQSWSYHWQAASGHMALMSRRVDLIDVYHHPDTTDLQRKKLAIIASVRRFAAQAMALPVKQQYSTYVDVPHDAVVWTVYATPALSLQPKTWCYWFAGCMHYRGYFDRSGAVKEQERLQGSGFDTQLVPTIAYSTLGYFADSVLSSFLSLSDVDLAGLLLHELAHSRVFIDGDTSFNEGFATVVEQEGVRRWLVSIQQPQLWQWYQRRLSHQQQVRQRILQSKDQLQQLYSSAASDADKLTHKRAIFSALQRDYQQYHLSSGSQVYHAWFARPLNNANLLTVTTYHSWVPAFRMLLQHLQGDLPRFYTEVERIGRMSREDRRAVMNQLLSESAAH